MGSREAQAFERETMDPRAGQEKRLLELVRRNQDTAFGRAHRFSAIKSISDFQRAVAINTYETLQGYIERAAAGEQAVLTDDPPFMFATTSGTTGSRKLIPITRSYVREFRKASVVSGYHLLQSFPGVKRGVSLSIFSPAEEGRTAGNIPYGAISGRLYLEEPKLIKKYVSPIPYEVFLIEDYESRYYTLLRCALMLPIATIYTLNPSTIVLLARRLSQYGSALIKDVAEGTLTAPAAIPPHIRKAVEHFLAPSRGRASELQTLLDADLLYPPHVWPQLSLICCWTKAAAAFYLNEFPRLYGNVPVCDITYGASEGRGTVCLGPGQQALALRSHFFEFIEEHEMDKPDARAYVVDELEEGKSYYVLFTTAGGLYRYNINDIVKVVGWHNRAPLIEFQHKGGNISSFTGEKVTESQVTEAVSDSCAKLGLAVRFFTVVPQFKPEPHYQLWVELSDQAADAQCLANEFDLKLGEKNIEYKAKRDSHRLSDARVYLLAPGAYESLRKSLVTKGVPDAQIKISHLNPKADVRAALEACLATPVN